MSCTVTTSVDVLYSHQADPEETGDKLGLLLQVQVSLRTAHVLKVLVKMSTYIILHLWYFERDQPVR